MANLPYATHPLVWLGDSLEAISGFPPSAKRVLGFGLRQVQNRLIPPMAVRLSSFGPGVYELKASVSKDTYRVVYVVKLTKAIYVLHCFMKKSKTGRKIPKGDRETIKSRLRHAKAADAE